VRFTVTENLFTLADVDREARALLKREKIPVPAALSPEFEVRDRQVFVTVKYLQGVGKPYWYVRFDRNLRADEWSRRTLAEKE